MDNELSTRLMSIADTLKEKRSLIEGLVQKVLDICDIAEIEKEVEETTEVTRGINVTLRNIERALSGNTVENHAPNMQSTPRQVETE